MTHPTGQPGGGGGSNGGTTGPGRLSDRALIRLFAALPWLGAMAVAAAWLAGR